MPFWYYSKSGQETFLFFLHNPPVTSFLNPCGVRVLRGPHPPSGVPCLSAPACLEMGLDWGFLSQLCPVHPPPLCGAGTGGTVKTEVEEPHFGEAPLQCGRGAGRSRNDHGGACRARETWLIPHHLIMLTHRRDHTLPLQDPPRCVSQKEQAQNTSLKCFNIYLSYLPSNSSMKSSRKCVVWL